MGSRPGPAVNLRAMAKVVITVIGNDRAGLVDRLSATVTESGGNWERSHLVELAGKFAGVVLVELPDAGVDALTAGLDAIEAEGLLHISLERASTTVTDIGVATAPAGRLELKLVGQDHEGIVHSISHALAGLGVNIDELATEVVPAPMGGTLFQAEAVLEAPAGLTATEIETELEAISPELMIDVEPLTADEPTAP